MRGVGITGIDLGFLLDLRQCKIHLFEQLIPKTGAAAIVKIHGLFELSLRLGM